MIINENFDDYVIGGKKVSEYYWDTPDEVDLSKLEYRKNIAKDTESDSIYYDMGAFVIDTDVNVIHHENGVDLSRLAGCLYNNVSYDEASLMDCIDGDDVINIRMNSIIAFRPADLLFEFTKLINATVFIDKTSKHVIVKGNAGTEEERQAFIDDYSNRFRRK